jgi:tRNA(Ile)-lysidine synthase
MTGAIDNDPISATQAAALFGDLATAPALVLAVSGGPDSTALLWLAARWRKKTKTRLVAVTIDHGLRQEAKREAAAVAKLARKLGVPHRILKWSGAKPTSGIQQAARRARYALLVKAAQQAGATHILTAHTLDDQAETVLMRMARGSGVTGLAGMARESALDGLTLVRPFLDLPKARLVATCRAAKLVYADDPSNLDPKFTRARLRPLMAALAQEGLDARRLASLARRLRRADAAIEAAVDAPGLSLLEAMPAAEFAQMPAEIALRSLGRMVGREGDEGPVELGKLETLFADVMEAVLKPANTPFRRTLAGAVVTVAGDEIRVERAPARRRPPALTKRRARPAVRRKAR